MRNTLLWPFIIIVSALAAGALTFLDAVPPVRAVVGFWFLLVCPGMAFIRLLHIKEGFVELILAIALSITINTIVSQASLLANKWSPRGVLLVVITISMGGVALQMVAPYIQRMDARRKKKQVDHSVRPPLHKRRDRKSSNH